MSRYTVSVLGRHDGIVLTEKEAEIVGYELSFAAKIAEYGNAYDKSELLTGVANVLRGRMRDGSEPEEHA